MEFYRGRAQDDVCQGTKAGLSATIVHVIHLRRAVGSKAARFIVERSSAFLKHEMERKRTYQGELLAALLKRRQRSSLRAAIANRGHTVEDRRSFATSELPAAKVRAIRKSWMSLRHAHPKTAES